MVIQGAWCDRKASILNVTPPSNVIDTDVSDEPAVSYGSKLLQTVGAEFISVVKTRKRSYLLGLGRE